MTPMFTSPEEWRQLVPAGRRAYLSSAVGHTLRAGALGMAVLMVAAGASDPYWRSLPVISVTALSLAGGGAAAWLLFRREWRAAATTYEQHPDRAR